MLDPGNRNQLRTADKTRSLIDSMSQAGKEDTIQLQSRRAQLAMCQEGKGWERRSSPGSSFPACRSRRLLDSSRSLRRCTYLPSTETVR